MGKELHVGHLRSAVIGDTLARVQEAFALRNDKAGANDAIHVMVDCDKDAGSEIIVCAGGGGKAREAEAAAAAAAGGGRTCC